MFKMFFYTLVVGGLCFGGWFVWDSFPGIREFIEEKFHSQNFKTLEIRFSPEEIMERCQHELLKGEGYSYLEPRLLFYPYVKMNTKFTTENSRTQEGILLWGLTDGEMVLNTTTWECTHGFEDCLIAKATKSDFKILKAILEAGGSIDRERLYQRFKAEGDLVDKWIQHCKQKKLIVTSGNRFRLHLEKPRMENIPITMIKEPLVAKPTRHSIKSKKRYSVHQIQKLAEIAFGPEFAIRKIETVFLPVYSIRVQNPDGSILTTYWNALNGRPFEQNYNY